MEPFVIDIVIVVVSLALFAAAYGGARLATRPARPPTGPAVPDLGDEPPAVVNLLANRWRLNEDAAESTLLDLAARGYLELRQPGADPTHTTIHLRPAGATADPAALQPYERRVLERVRGLAVDGVIPVTALTFRNAHQAKVWTRRLHREVVADARARGLSRRRLSPTLTAGLIAVAAVSAGGIFLAALRLTLRDDSGETSPMFPFWAGAMAFLVLAGIATQQRGERDTAAGRAAASRWLGVRAWLRAHEDFADLPPAAVAVWDRYLPYGAALGVTHTASAVLDLGMGNRRLVWSSYGGRWRRVRVRYPRFWSRYGQGVPSLLLPALFTMIIGGLVIRYHQVPTDFGTVNDPELRRNLDLVAQIILGLGVLLVARGGYRAVRALTDLATTRTITGEVLWREVWRTRSQGKNRPRKPWLDYLAVDDGSADRTTAWGLPRDVADAGCRDGDTVTIRVRPWSRRVVEVQLVERGRAARLVDSPAATGEPTATSLGGVLDGLLGGSSEGQAEPVPVTAEEVGRALGMAVRDPEPMPGPGFVRTMMFRTADRGRQVMMLQVARGTAAKWAWSMNQRGTPLPGIGDGAFLAGNRAAARLGDNTVVLTLLGRARGRHQHLPWLLQQAAARLGGSTTAAADLDAAH